MSSSQLHERPVTAPVAHPVAPEEWEPGPPCLPCCETETRPAHQIGAFRIVACRRCGTARVDPRLRAEARLERVYNRPGYFTRPVGSGAFFQPLRHAIWRRLVSLYQHPDAQERRAAFLESFVPADRPIRFLEIGCGTGKLLRVLDRCCPRWSLTGVDPSDVAARACRESGLRVLTGTAEEVALDGERFHAVCAWNVIEHVDDPHAFLQWIVRHLEPGGHLFLHTPNYGGWMRRLYGSRWFELKPEYHLYLFNHPGLTRLLESVGLTRVYPEAASAIHDIGHQIRMVARK